jgi:hypothetical protein
MPLADKFVILDYLCGLSPKRSELPSENDWMIYPKQKADLYIFNQLAALRVNLDLLSWQVEEASLHQLHKAPSEEQHPAWNNPQLFRSNCLEMLLLSKEHPAWSDQLFTLLTKTAIPDCDRVMIYDDLAGLYSHHLHMFELHTNEEPSWDIVQMATQ